jgi:hypothetical protein
MIFTGNYKDSTKTITFAEIEAAGLSSDLTAPLGPKRPETLRFRSFSYMRMVSTHRKSLAG